MTIFQSANYDSLDRNILLFVLWKLLMNYRIIGEIGIYYWKVCNKELSFILLSMACKALLANKRCLG